MNALVHIGEVGLHHAGGSLLLRPSLLAMSSLGTPSEIVTILAIVFGEGLSNKSKKDIQYTRKRQLKAAIEVWVACSAHDDDLDPICGYFSERDNFVLGAADPGDVIVVAQILLRHGVLGDPEPPNEMDEPPKDDQYSPSFDCRKMAALAMGHLSLSETEAWSLTMTGLRLALEAKYPKPKDAAVQRAPSISEYDATMDWFDKVKAKRGGK